jgi:hypothetical protein
MFHDRAGTEQGTAAAFSLATLVFTRLRVFVLFRSVMPAPVRRTPRPSAGGHQQGDSGATLAGVAQLLDGSGLGRWNRVFAGADAVASK